MSPSPAISFEVSTTTTRLPSSSASTRAASRSIVVLPTPGRPSSRIDSPRLDHVAQDVERAEDGAARRGRSGRRRPRRGCGSPRCGAGCARSPRGCPCRSGRPARPRSAMSSRVTGRSERNSPRSGKRVSGWRPRSRTSSMSSPLPRVGLDDARTDGGITSRSSSRSSVVDLPPRRGPPLDPKATPKATTMPGLATFPAPARRHRKAGPRPAKLDQKKEESSDAQTDDEDGAPRPHAACSAVSRPGGHLEGPFRQDLPAAAPAPGAG